MRRQFMRIFSPVTSLCKCYTKMPLTYFQFSTTTSAQGYKTLFQQLKQSPSNIESVTNILQKLFLHIPQLNVNELKELATTIQATQITDEGQAQKIFDRTTKLFLEEKANLTDTLNVLSAILQRGYSSNHYKQQYHFVAAVSQASHLEASQISSAMYIYGQLVSITQSKNDDVAELLYCHFKNEIDNFKSKDLRDYALGAMMSEEDSDDVYDLIERQALNIEMEFSDLIRVVTAVALNTGGSDELWKLLEEQAIKNIPTTDPLNISSLLMIYKQLGHGTQEIYKLMEESFLQNYEQLTTNIKLEMFSGFARVQHPSSSVFTLFFRDIVKIIDQSSVKSVEMLIYDSLEIFASFPEIVQDYFIDYMIDNKEQMSEPVKEKIFEYLQANDLLTDELEVALQQKK